MPRHTHPDRDARRRKRQARRAKTEPVAPLFPVLIFLGFEDDACPWCLLAQSEGAPLPHDAPSRPNLPTDPEGCAHGS